MHTQEEIEKHFAKMQKLDARLNLKKGKYGSIIKGSKNDLFNLLGEYSFVIEEKSTEIPGGLMTHLENNQLPSDIIFHAYGPEKYFNITHNKTSPYSALYDGEIQMLLDLVNNNPEYVHKNIVDIGCGDGIKLYEMMQEGLKNNKIDGTIDYLGLDDSQDMLNFAKENFYNSFYSKTKNKQGNRHISSNDIDSINKKIRPWFQKARFQTIKGLENRTPKTMLFLGGTFGNLPAQVQKSFLEDIKKMMQPGDTFVLSYFRVLDNNTFDNEYSKDLMNNFFEREKKRFADHNIYYAEKEKDIANFQKSLPGIKIGHKDFDVHMERDAKNQIIYDVRTFKKDIIYGDEIIISKGTSFKSEGTPIDQETLKKELEKEDMTKNFVESLYRTKETKDFINDFFISKGVDPQDIFIDVEYTSQDSKLHINIRPLRPITLRWTEEGKLKSITKYPTDIINFHESKRFKDQEIQEIVSDTGLNIVDEIGFKSELAGQAVMKLLIIQK